MMLVKLKYQPVTEMLLIVLIKSINKINNILKNHKNNIWEEWLEIVIEIDMFYKDQEHNQLKMLRNNKFMIIILNYLRINKKNLFKLFVKTLIPLLKLFNIKILQL